MNVDYPETEGGYSFHKDLQPKSKAAKQLKRK